ncbi:unnamed protein product [Ambrosiozyma monospora]|uniref:Unnamed protein product n=1 Tax=Ambrosiozyma monospora TaxID=43982 RepID=A0ACB5STS8_AMBMO|nr:unnamed protein product [Ambrosiozyma monospora]
MVESYWSEYTNSYDEYRTIIIYVDGACSGNNQRGANRWAGAGVFYGPNDHRNKSVYLGCGPHLTNQYAELTAMKIGLTCILDEWNKNHNELYRVEIRSDSRYAINCVTKWWKSWEHRGWVTSVGNPVANQDLIRDCLDLIDDINSNYQDVGFENLEINWVQGHSGVYGNEMADDLANEAIDNESGDTIYYYNYD